MEIISVSDSRFREYGRVMEDYDFRQLLCVMKAATPLPSDGTVYVASEPKLEALTVAAALKNRGFGGLDIQIGYCNGVNSRLTCLEYHRTSELDIACDDIILLLARQQELEGYTLDTDRVRAFFVAAGTGVELFANTLHYAPCGAARGQGFRMGCVLPRGTNQRKPMGTSAEGEDRLITGINKWVIAGAGAPETTHGAFVGLYGEEIDLYP